MDEKKDEKKEVAPPPARVPAPSEGVRSTPFDRLPRSVQWVMSRVPSQDWRFVETLVCRLPFTRDLVNAVQFADTVWGLARNAEFRTVDRITGAEMDGFRAELDAAAWRLVSVTVALALRARLTETVQRYRRVLRRFGISNGAAPAQADPAAHGAVEPASPPDTVAA